jgi:hypothetical protein
MFGWILKLLSEHLATMIDIESRTRVLMFDDKIKNKNAVRFNDGSRHDAIGRETASGSFTVFVIKSSNLTQARDQIYKKTSPWVTYPAG